MSEESENTVLQDIAESFTNGQFQQAYEQWDNLPEGQADHPVGFMATMFGQEKALFYTTKYMVHLREEREESRREALLSLHRFGDQNG
jgi:hypothetical protein